MKRFVSRFEKIRHLRTQQEVACRAQVAARNTERTAIEQRRDSTRNRLDAIEREAGLDMATGITGAVLNSLANHIEQAKQQLRNENELLRTAEEKLQESVIEHQRARTELRVVEELIDREQVEHRRTQLRTAEHQLQEQAAQAHFGKIEHDRDGKL